MFNLFSENTAMVASPAAKGLGYMAFMGGVLGGANRGSVEEVVAGFVGLAVAAGIYAAAKNVQGAQKNQIN